MTPYDYCVQKAAQTGSAHHYSFMFLSPERRRAITALSAFCREVDQAVNQPSDPEVARTKLGWWRNETARLFAGAPQHPVARALQPALEQFAIGEQHLVDIMNGREQDLDQPRYGNFDSLEKYCNGIADTGARLAARICGVKDDRTLEHASKLGLAIALSELLINQGEDARRNRITVPMDELKQFDVPAADILNRRTSENFRNLMSFQATRAEKLIQDALRILPAEDRRAQLPGLIMAGIYRALLDEIRRGGFAVLTHRTTLTPVRMLWIAWRTRLSA